MAMLDKRKSGFLILIIFFCVAAAAQDLPGIAVYVTGDVPSNKKKALGTRMLSTFVNSGLYKSIERSNSFFAELEKEHEKQRGTELDGSQISALGKQFDLRYVCVADITPAFDSYQVSARIVDVESAEIVHIGESSSPLQTMNDLERVSHEIVSIVFRGQSTPEPAVLEPPPVESISQAPEPQIKQDAKPPKKPAFWLGLSLETAGVGILAYGIYENVNVKNLVSDKKYGNAEKAEKRRNIAYIVGASVLLSGISVHIFF